MKVALSELSGSGVVYQLNDDSWIGRDETAGGHKVEGTVTVRRTGDLEAEITGAVIVKALVSCDRCNQSSQISVESKFAYECVVGKEELLLSKSLSAEKKNLTGFIWKSRLSTWAKYSENRFCWLYLCVRCVMNRAKGCAPDVVQI